VEVEVVMVLVSLMVVMVVLVEELRIIQLLSEKE
jgi:hypothetical protein